MTDQEPVAPIRVLLVDDAVVARRVIVRAFDAEADLVVVGVARDRDAALRRADELRPDIVVLDPAVFGRSRGAALAELRRRHPQLPIVVFSRTAEDPTLRGRILARGATACVAKPGSRDGIGLTVDQVRAELATVVRRLGGRREPGFTGASERQGSVSQPAGPGPVEAIVVATSTGGPAALESLVSALPHDLPVPLIVLQHMPDPFVPMLVARLGRAGGLPVLQARHGEPILPGRVYLAPGGVHLKVGGTHSQPVAELDAGPAENSCRPAADVLLCSAASLWGRGLLAVILTGMGCDGVRGCTKVREHGGTVLVQDQSTSVVWGMPRLVAEKGLAHEVLPLPDIAPKLVALVAASGSVAGR